MNEIERFGVITSSDIQPMILDTITEIESMSKHTAVTEDMGPEEEQSVLKTQWLSERIMELIADKGFNTRKARRQAEREYEKMIKP